MKMILQCTAIALALSGCINFSNRLESDEELEAFIEAEVRASLSDNIGLAPLMEVEGFAWSHLVVLAPYTDISAVESELDVSLNGLRHFDIGQRDDVCLLVFMEGNAPVRVAAFPRSVGDFAEVDPVLIPRKLATFQVEPTPSGRVKMRLVGR